MLKAETLAAYRAGLDRISDGAAQYVERMLREAAARHPDMTVAEWRDLATAAMQAAAETYGEAGASLACELYDARVRASGYDKATMGITLDPARAMATARYQVGKLVDGDLDGFIRECSAFCSDYVREATNSTMTGNWKRSRRSASRSRSATAKAGNAHGVRFARVPQGGDTCTFCAMLASRGFVYWTRKTAGEFNHYHRNCRCVVVPDDGSGEVEGYDPDEWLDKWGKFKEIDADEALTSGQQADAKALIASGRASTFSDVKEIWYKEAEQFAANIKAVQSREYFAALRDVFDGDVGLADRVWKDARHTLKMRSGTSGEDLYAYDLDTGKRIARQTDGKARLSAAVSDETKDALRKATKAGHRVVLMHNHPGSSGPSAADFATLARSGAEYGLIACHDGSIIRFTSSAELVNLDKASAKALDRQLGRRYASALEYGRTEQQAFDAIKKDLGVRVERIQVDY